MLEVRQLHARYGDTIPAILLTADRSLEVRQLAAERDIPVLNKPIKPAALRSMLARYQKAQAAAE